MAGRPNSLPWNFATFTGNEPVTTLSDNFNSLNNIINDSGAGFTTSAVDTGTTNNLIVTLASPPVAYEAGMMVAVSPANTNTAGCAINVNALGNVSIVTPSGTSLGVGAIAVNKVALLVYNGSAFVICGTCPVTANLNPSTAATVECAGASSIFIQSVWAAGNLSLTLNHVPDGIPITVVMTNQSGGASTYGLNMTNPAGGVIATVNALPSGTTGGSSSIVNLHTAGISINNTAYMIFQGSVYGGTFAFFSH